MSKRQGSYNFQAGILAEMPRAGLMFVAFGAEFDAFEAQTWRIAGIDDGVIDALIRFTQSLTAAYYWCPPMKQGKVDFSRLLQ